MRVNGNRSRDAFSFANTAEVLLSESSASNSPGYGFFFDTVARAVASGLTTFNVASANPLHRAVWFQNLGNLAASNVTVSDSQTTPTGYIVGTAYITHGSIQNLASNITFGSLTVQNWGGVALAQIN
jgi:hypothetical protein